MKYNWKYKNWPQFKYVADAINKITLEFALETGEVKGIIEGLSVEFQQETVIQFMIDEAIKTSEIEGEYYSRQDVMSSIKNRLGISHGIERIRDINARGIAELMVEVRQQFTSPLTEELIRDWHEILFSGSRLIRGGQYRIGAEPMVIVSGSYGREIIHYEAPPSERVPCEMKEFVTWYDGYKVGQKDLKDGLIKTAIAHLYFESIHPFEDGNGRIGRAIAEKCLSESIGHPLVMSLSTTIERNKRFYYDALKAAQQSLEITDWIIYFSQTILEAQKEAKKSIRFTLDKTKFIDKYKSGLNERQMKAILKMLDCGIDGFEGGMTAKKYMSIAKTSKATATRDLQNMVEKGALKPKGAGRGTHYEVNIIFK